MGAIEQFCCDFQVWKERVCAQVDGFSAELLLREALMNSVLHGCAGNPRKRVCCVLRTRSRRLFIAVRDEGKGFDWRALWNRHADVDAARGRGLEILRKYSDAVRFNAKGNAVMLMTRFER